MAITVQDRHGTYGRTRKAEGPPLDKRTARYFAVVDNVWSRGFPTRKAAEQVERKMRSDADRGVSLSGSVLTLREFFEGVSWPSVDARQKRGDIALGTALHYKIVAESYILPTLGAKRLRHLRAADLRTLYAELRDRDKPLSPRTIQAAHRVASMMLVFAVEDGYIASNPTLMLRAVVSVPVVSEHLGHASASITMDVYAHVLRDQRSDATAKSAAAIDGT